MTQVGRARKTLLRKHITKEGAVVQTSKPAKYKDLEQIKMSEGS